MTGARAEDRRALLDALDVAEAGGLRVPCRVGSLADRAHWTAEDHRAQAEAAAACAGCPGLAECQEYGSRWPSEAGVYGGTTERDRMDPERVAARQRAAAAHRRRRARERAEGAA